MAQESTADFFTGPTAQEKLRLRARDMMSRTTDPWTIAKISQEAAAIERGERKHPEYEADLMRDKTRQAVAARAKELGVTPDNPADFASVAIETIMRHNYPGAERDAMLVLQWRQMQEASARAAELQKAQIEKTKAEAASEGKGRGEYFVPVDTAEGVKAFDARRGVVVDPTQPGQPIKTPVVKSSSDTGLQRRLSANKEAGRQTGEEQRMLDGKLDAVDALAGATEMLDKGIYSGGWAEWQMKAAKLGPMDKTRAANTERFQAYLGDVIIPGLKEFGGNDSNEERAYLEKVRGGQITMEEGALRKILETAQRKIMRGVARARKRAREAGLPADETPAQGKHGTTDADGVPTVPGLPAGWKVKVKSK